MMRNPVTVQNHHLFALLLLLDKLQKGPSFLGFGGETDALRVGEVPKDGVLGRKFDATSLTMARSCGTRRRHDPLSLARVGEPQYSSCRSMTRLLLLPYAHLPTSNWPNSARQNTFAGWMDGCEARGDTELSSRSITPSMKWEWAWCEWELVLLCGFARRRKLAR